MAIQDITLRVKVVVNGLMKTGFRIQHPEGPVQMIPRIMMNGRRSLIHLET